MFGIIIKRQYEMQGEVLLLHRKRQDELFNELESTAGKKNIYRVAKQITKSSQDVM